MSGRLTTDEVTTWEGLWGLGREWSALWDRCPGATPFQSPEWLLPWSKHLGRGRLCGLALRAGKELVGVAPLFRTSYWGLPLRRLCLLGTGNTDYLDFLIHPEHQPDALRTLRQHLERHQPGWDFCDFQQLRPGSLVGQLETEGGFGSATTEQEACPFLPLPESVEAWEKSLPPKLRSNLRYYRRRLEREGDAVLETASEESLGAALEALFHLHGARWRRRKLPGVFASPRVREFHRDVAAGFLRRGWLRLYTLRFRGEIRAALYCFAAGGRTYYYAGGFDPELGRLSPGTVLTGYAIEQAVREGCREFDFLRGDEPYKYAWGARDRMNVRRLLWRPGFPGDLVPTLARLEHGVEQRVKRAARRLAR